MKKFKILNEQAAFSCPGGTTQLEDAPPYCNFGTGFWDCAGGPDGYYCESAYIETCCTEPVEPTPGEEGTCRKVMDDIIPNNYNSTGQEWCKKNCKDSNAIVMIAYGNDQINGCKCCGEFNIDQVGPVLPPQADIHANGLTLDNVFICESGTQYSGNNVAFAPGALCDNYHQSPWPDVSNIYQMLDNYHYAFQSACCTPQLTYSEIQLDIADELDSNDNPNTVNESLVKRFKKLAGIKKSKK